MGKCALILVKEVSGVTAMAARLVEEFGFELLVNAVAAAALAEKGIPFREVDTNEGTALVGEKELGVALVMANFVDVESAGRSFMSWKSALAAFDRGIVDTIRAAAWAVERVAVLGNPADYESALEELRGNGGKFRQAFRMERATAALRATSEFDFAVAQYLEVQGADVPDMGALSGYGKAMRFAWQRTQLLDTGENAHQRAALYGSFFEHFQQVAGKKLDYASVLTVSRAAYLVGEFEKSAAALLRNGKIVTVACGHDFEAVLQRVLKHDDLVGSWLVVNGSLGRNGLESVISGGVVGILAPDFSNAERGLLSEVDGLWALTSTAGMGYEALQEVRSVVGGVLVQDKDRAAINPMDWTVASFAQPLVEDWESLLFGARVVRHADSAALAIVSHERLVALEAGHYSTARAWTAVEESGIGLVNTVGIFDDPNVDAETLTRMKELGVRAVLLPFGGDEATLRNAANDCGLVVMTIGKSLRRL